MPFAAEAKQKKLMLLKMRIKNSKDGNGTFNGTHTLHPAAHLPLGLEHAHRKHTQQACTATATPLRLRFSLCVWNPPSPDPTPRTSDLEEDGPGRHPKPHQVAAHHSARQQDHAQHTLCQSQPLNRLCLPLARRGSETRGVHCPWPVGLRFENVHP